MRNIAIRKFGLDTVNRKESFEGEHFVGFVEAYRVRHQGYRHLVVDTMTIVMFGGMCQYDDADAFYGGTSAS